MLIVGFSESDIFNFGNSLVYLVIFYDFNFSTQEVVSILFIVCALPWKKNYSNLYFAELTNDFSSYEKETIIRWLSWTPTEPIRLNNLGTNYTMKTQYKQEEGFPSGFFPFLLDFRCLVTSIFSLSLSCFGSAVDLEKVLEFIGTIWI